MQRKFDLTIVPVVLTPLQFRKLKDIADHFNEEVTKTIRRLIEDEYDYLEDSEAEEYDFFNPMAFDDHFPDE